MNKSSQHLLSTYLFPGTVLACYTHLHSVLIATKRDQFCLRHSTDGEPGLRGVKPKATQVYQLQNLSCGAQPLTHCFSLVRSPLCRVGPVYPEFSPQLPLHRETFLL